MDWFLFTLGSVFYLVFGFVVAIAPWFDEEKNSIKKIGIALVWPVFVILGSLMLIRSVLRRLGRDAVVLLPKRTPRPQRVVVMPEVAGEPPVVCDPHSYQPHQWIN